MYKLLDGTYEKRITIDGKRDSFSGRIEKIVLRKILEY